MAFPCSMLSSYYMASRRGKEIPFQFPVGSQGGREMEEQAAEQTWVGKVAPGPALAPAGMISRC